MQWIENQALGQKYAKLTHKSGLQMLLCPMEGYQSTYAVFATPLGSVNEAFRLEGQQQPTVVPAGTAHFLEHKMFENEEGDAFARYALTGASANAFTSFDKTCYLFSCTDHFTESLEILLDFVQRPYFTEESVEKEQGIIGQEIKMYDDSGEWCVMFNLLSALYQNHPVRIDIAGTVDTIAQITPKVLYDCHKAFYSLSQMVLCVTGNFKIEDVLAVADKMLTTAAPEMKLEKISSEEPSEVANTFVSKKLSVAMPLFQLGFKEHSGSVEENLRNQMLDELLLDILCGDASPFYRTLYDEGLINSEFYTECMTGPGYFCNIFSGESRSPEETARRIKDEIARVRREGIDAELFELCKKSAYGQSIGLYTRPDTMGNLMVGAHFAGADSMYYPIEALEQVTLDALNERLREGFDENRSALSVVFPAEPEEEEI